MSVSLLFRNGALCLAASALPLLCFGQEGFLKNGGEYGITGPLPGLQAKPQAAVNSAGGFLVWEDNVADGKGLGIRAQALNADLTKVGAPFRVNQIAPGDQENAHVALLRDGGAVFVWQGGRQGFQHIYARFFSPSNTWLGGDVTLSSFPANFQALPAVAVLDNGNVLVAWGSFNQQSSTSMQDIYAQIVSPTGELVGTNFLVNIFTPYNQRSPAICTLPGGHFLVAWVSELQRTGPIDQSDSEATYPIHILPSVDIFARIFSNDGTPSGNEFLVNTGNDPCANPSVASTSDGGFLIAWSQKDTASPRHNSWDIYGRTFSNLGIGGPTRCLNSYLYGDQFAPQVSSSGTNFVVLWTSMGQDGNWEGVYGQVIANSGTPSGSEFLVNTSVASRQFQPAITSDGRGRLLAVWSAYSGTADFDLFAQRYIPPDYAPDTSLTNSYAAPYTDPYLNNSTSTEPPRLDPPVITGTSNTVSIGVYSGLFYETNGINVGSGGAFNAAVAKGGAFSGKISVAGKTWPVSGLFGASGDAVARVSRGNLHSLSLHLHQANGQITGQITDGQWTANVLAYANTFSRTNPAGQAGSFMLDVPGAAISADSPGGDSFGPVKVDALGNVQWVGNLADGSKLTQKSALSAQGLWPVYVSLYGGRGLVMGWVQVTNSSVSGQVVWIKPSGITGKYYPSGFTNEITVAGIPLGASKSSSSSGMKLSPGNRNVILVGGGLSAPIMTRISIDSNGRVTNLGGNKLTLNISASTGLFRGSVVDPRTGKPLLFQGAVFDDWDVGLGYFLNPAQSGQALIAPAP